MSGSMVIQGVAFVFLLLLSGFRSGSETAFFSLDALDAIVGPESGTPARAPAAAS